MCDHMWAEAFMCMVCSPVCNVSSSLTFIFSLEAGSFPEPAIFLFGLLEGSLGVF